MRPWKKFPTPEIPAAVFALAGDPSYVFAGGAGGLARYADGAWQPCPALPLASCSALVWEDGWLLVGSADGLARSEDGGQTWERATVSGETHPVMALASAPAFARRGIALAGTLGGGVLRTEDGGQSWSPANFGLQNPQVLALAWVDEDTALAGTDEGVFRSTNAGAAWRAAPGTAGSSIAGIIVLPGGAALAVGAGGDVLRSTDGGAHWSPVETSGLPAQREVQAFARAPWGTLLLALSEAGVYQSSSGEDWQPYAQEEVLVMAAAGERLYAGLDSGAAELHEGGLQQMAPPPLHDLRSLLVHRQSPILTGLHSQAWMHTKKDGWRPLLEEPDPVIAAAEAPDGSLLISTARALLRSADGGRSWEVVHAYDGEAAAYLTWRANGFGWAASADGALLLRTRDGGKSWEPQPTPFANRQLAALQATPQELFAATYDAGFGGVQVWRAEEDGQNWRQSAEARTTWPVVASLSSPSVLTIGNALLFRRPNGSWNQRHAPGGGGIRRIAGSGSLLLVLSTAGFYRTLDRGFVWDHEPDCPPHDEIADIALEEDRLYLLLRGGRLQVRAGER